MVDRGETDVRRTWVDVADVVLALGLCAVAALAVVDGRLPEAGLAFVLALAWGARGVVAIRRRALSAAHRPAGRSGTHRPATR